MLHGAARTTPRVRAELQAKESTRTLAVRYGLNAKTVAKWRKRTTTADRPMGPSRPKRTVLTEIEEASRPARPLGWAEGKVRPRHALAKNHIKQPGAVAHAGFGFRHDGVRQRALSTPKRLKLRQSKSPP
jgi:hypothetical protein